MPQGKTSDYIFIIELKKKTENDSKKNNQAYLI